MMMGDEDADNQEGGDQFGVESEHGHRMIVEQGKRRNGGRDIQSRGRERKRERVGVEYQFVGP